MSSPDPSLAGRPPVADCIFCQIIAGELPARIVWETDKVVAFWTIEPMAPTHILLVPREHLPDALSLDASHAKLLADLLVVGRRIAEAEGVANSGFRLVVNVGADGGMTVDHLHMHLLGGRAMSWPPG